MGFLSAISNFGSIGSTAKWAIKGYSSIKSNHSNLQPGQIFFEMIKIRLGASPSFLKGKYDAYLLSTAKNKPGLAGLVIEILNAEADLCKNLPDYIKEMIIPIFDKLEETNLSQIEKYGFLKDEHSANDLSPWVIYTLGFYTRVLDDKYSR
jgi:hypothetical protein